MVLMETLVIADDIQIKQGNGDEIQSLRKNVKNRFAFLLENSIWIKRKRFS